MEIEKIASNFWNRPTELATGVIVVTVGVAAITLAGVKNPAKQVKVKELERQIDWMVYELYGLTPEEIAVVEGNNK